MVFGQIVNLKVIFQLYFYKTREDLTIFFITDVLHLIIFKLGHGQASLHLDLLYMS